MLKDVKPRTYQESIFNTTTKKNTLVVLPTGLGKTMISLLLTAHRLINYPKSKILVLAPTKPLVEQHLKTFKKHLNIKEEKIVLFTGLIKPDKRAELWKQARVVISTPQGIENDIITKRIFLEDVSLLVFDEAHRAVGDYAYVFVAKQYEKQSKHTKILGLTASPGSEKAHIEEVCQNLFIENLEIRTEEDSDIKPYVQEMDVKWVEITFPENLKFIKSAFEQFVKNKLNEVKKLGYLYGQVSNYTKKALLGLQADLRGRISSGEKDFNILRSISLLAEVMKVQHALELLETQGLEPLQKYIEKLETQAKTGTVKAVKNLMNDAIFLKAKQGLLKLIEEGEEHPKIDSLKKLMKEEVEKKENIKAIIFTQYRSSALKIKKVLNECSLKSKIFIGQNKKDETGLTQKEQKEIIEEFSEGKFNCLISTSVGEEGLDIPQVDLVVFYEPIPSAIRSIQRRGRTGRLKEGRVIVLMTKNTRDEAYRWSSHHKERKMHNNLRKLKEKFSKIEFMETKNEEKLTSFIEELKIKIVVDQRERGSKIIKKLVEKGVTIDLQQLAVGDYLLSEEVAVEYKKKKDFVNSIIDGRLLQQIRELTSYVKPLLIVEGEEDIYSQRNIHQNAIRGMLSTIAVSYRIPIIYTKNEHDTAELLYVIAKREQDPEKKVFQMHTAKPLSLKEQQEYIVSSIPGIGGKLAKPLLKKFKSVKKIVNAKEYSLKKIALIGEKKAKKIRETLDLEYKE
ncbi:DEAD/DEAH box helicase family protein [Candidatus Woesearchaeota archaeon]|nr:DEAD/DEAH box helicase family protein [Candidatus Woesearchaeota archaeon]